MRQYWKFPFWINFVQKLGSSIKNHIFRCVLSLWGFIDCILKIYALASKLLFYFQISCLVKCKDVGPILPFEKPEKENILLPIWHCQLCCCQDVYWNISNCKHLHLRQTVTLAFSDPLALPRCVKRILRVVITPLNLVRMFMLLSGWTILTGIILWPRWIGAVFSGL